MYHVLIDLLVKKNCTGQPFQTISFQLLAPTFLPKSVEKSLKRIKVAHLMLISYSASRQNVGIVRDTFNSSLQVRLTFNELSCICFLVL